MNWRDYSPVLDTARGIPSARRSWHERLGTDIHGHRGGADVLGGGELPEPPLPQGARDHRPHGDIAGVFAGAGHVGAIGVVDQHDTRELVDSLHFDEVLLEGMLGYLLFAGALHIDLTALRGVLLQIATLATFSVLASGAIVGTLFWGVAHLLGFDIGLIHGLLFGALIAPNDPVAAIGILKGVNAPESLRTTIAGESLFNDGIGVVLFLTVASIAFAGEEPALTE
jgi:NhaP-type Na+/H+ or K+/H+ antiporter